jgi:hypothetical protein
LLISDSFGDSLQKADSWIAIATHATGFEAFRKYGAAKVGKGIKGLVKNRSRNLNLRGMVKSKLARQRFEKLNKASETLGYVLYVYEIGSLTYGAVDKIDTGRGSVSGQTANIAVSLLTKSPINYIGMAAGAVDLALDTQTTEVMDRLQEAAFDPVAKEHMVSEAIGKMEEEGTVDCAADPSTCGMGGFQGFIWTVGRGIGF